MTEDTTGTVLIQPHEIPPKPTAEETMAIVDETLAEEPTPAPDPDPEPEPEPETGDQE
jgi:hypothetical protein